MSLSQNLLLITARDLKSLASEAQSCHFEQRSLFTIITPPLLHYRAALASDPLSLSGTKEKAPGKLVVMEVLVVIEPNVDNSSSAWSCANGRSKAKLTEAKLAPLKIAISSLCFGVGGLCCNYVLRCKDSKMKT